MGCLLKPLIYELLVSYQEEGLMSNLTRQCHLKGTHITGYNISFLGLKIKKNTFLFCSPYVANKTLLGFCFARAAALCETVSKALARSAHRRLKTRPLSHNRKVIPSAVGNRQNKTPHASNTDVGGV